MKLSIEKVIYGGQGLARIPEGSGPQSGMRVFVPFTLPGETVEAEITGAHRGYCEGILQSIEQPSEFRATAPCPWFGVCGGCQLQHSDYAFQLELKRAMLAESLTRAGLRDLPAIGTLHGAPFEYRNRIRLHVQTQPEFAIGYRQARSHRITAIERCPIALPLLQRCIAVTCSSGLRNMLPKGMREVELFTNHDQSELLLTAWHGGGKRFEGTQYAELFAALQKDLPQFIGAMVLPEEKKSATQKNPLLRWGNQQLQYRVDGRKYSVSIGSFFQTNSTLLDAFVTDVIGNASGDIAWDLYAGVGLFSAALAENFKTVVAVEANSSACGDLRRNLKAASTILQATTFDALRDVLLPQVRSTRAAPDLIVLDPPRAGAGIDVCRLISRCGPRRIVYVSCDPATLGRDLAALIQSGYQLRTLQLVDMFPQTGHLETIATLEH